MCPSAEELSKPPVWGVTTSCAECLDRYMRNDAMPMAGVPLPYSPFPDSEREYRDRMPRMVRNRLIRRFDHNRLDDLVRDLAATHGSISDSELAAARAEWPQARSA